MQENTPPIPPSEPQLNQVNNPVPERVNAFNYPEQRKTPVQFNLAQHKINPLILILLIVIFLLGLGIILWKFVFNENVEFLNAFRAAPSPTPTTVVAMPTVTPTVNPTVNWKTYNNKTFNYSFRYPSDWKITTMNNENSETASTLAINNICDYNKGEICSNIDILSIPAEDYVVSSNLADYFNKNIKQINDKKNLQYEVLNGIQTFRISTPVLTQIGFIVNKTAFWITYSEQSKTPISELKYKNIFSQILSTFKFVEKSNISVTPIATQSGFGR